MDNKEEILLNFQAITGMDDIPMCLDILEQKEWDLTAALKGVMPQEDFSGTSTNGPSTSSNGAEKQAFIDLTDEGGSSTPIQESQGSQCSLGVYFKERLIRLDLSLDTALADVKGQLEVDTGIPAAEQVLSGWPKHTQNQLEDHITLSELGIQGGVYHIRMDHQYPSHCTPFPLSHVHLSPQSLKRYNELPNPYSDAVVQTSLDVRLPEGSTLQVSQDRAPSDIRSISVDPGSVDDRVSSQGSWEDAVTDWPEKKKGANSVGETSSGGGGEGGGGGDDDDVMVVAVEEHKPMETKEGEKKTGRHLPLRIRDDGVVEVLEVHDSSGSSHSSDCDAIPEFVEDDDLYVDNGPDLSALRDPLVPEDCTEPYEALQCFTHSFEQRYGAMHPLFLLGSLSEAVSEATIGSASSGTRKPMLVYLHHDGSVLSNVFCSQLLCSESVVNYLSLNYISWAWDLTHFSHRLKLLQMVEECFGASGKTQVNEINENQLPVILIAFKEKGSVGIKSVIQGSTSLDSMMTTLIAMVEQHNFVIQREMQEEHDRMMREHMIAEQNRAYEESLQADREKERKKKEQEIEEEEQRQTKEAVRRAMSECVPEEPPADCLEKICTLRLRYPDGQVGQRRFLASHTLGDLFNFVGSKTYNVDNYKILTGFPRKDLSEQSVELTLEELKLCPQETLIIEERTT